MTLLDDGLPALEIPHPICSHCRQDVEIEDESARCLGCRVSWFRIDDGAIAEPDEYAEGADVPCEIPRPQIVEEYDHKGQHVHLEYKPCILPSGHETKAHLWPYDYLTTPIEQEAAA